MSKTKEKNTTYKSEFLKALLSHGIAELKYIEKYVWELIYMKPNTFSDILV